MFPKGRIMLKLKHINLPWEKTSAPIPGDLPVVRMESHKNVEITVMLEGHAGICYDGGYYSFSKGDVFVILPGVEHSALLEQVPCRQLWLWPGSRTVCGAIIEVDGGTGKHRTIDRRNFGEKMFCPWLAEMFREGSEVALPPEKVQGALLLLLSEYLEPRCLSSADGHPEALPDQQRADIHEICQYIDVCGGAGLSVERLARMANYSVSHFARLFRLHTGMTVHRRIDLARRKKAAELLERHSDQKSIAEALGFSGASAYCLWRRKSAEPSRSGKKAAKKS